MPEEVSKLSGKVSLDSAEFKKNILDMNRDVRLLESGFRAGAAGFTNWKNDATALESRIKTLTSQIDIQKQKVALLTAEHQRLVAAEGANSSAAQNMEFQVNGATKTLNKMQTELVQDKAALDQVRGNSAAAGVALTGMGLAAGAAQAGLAGLKGMASLVILELKSIAATIQGEVAVAFGVLKVGIGAVAGLGAAAVLAGVLVGGLTLKAATAADQLGELSVKTGISVERLQELGFVGKVVGMDIDTIGTTFSKLIRSMASAKDGTGAQADAFKTLGVHVRDVQGNLRDSNTVFGETLDALGKVSNETDQAALAQAIFGKGYQELIPLIKLGSKGLAEMSDEAHRMGAVVSTEDITALGDLRDQFDKLKLGLAGVGTTILAAFAPFFSGALQTATGYLERLVSIVQASGGDFTKLAQGTRGLFSNIISDVANSLPELMKNGMAIVQSLIQALLDAAPQLTTAAVGIVTMLSDFILQNLPLLASVATTILDTLTNSIIPLLPTLITVGIAIIQTLVNALLQALPTLLPLLANTGMQIVTMILNAVQIAAPALLQGATLILQTLITFLQSNLSLLIAIGIPLITQLIQAILPFLPMLVDAALQILTALANAIAQQLPVLTPVIVQVVTQIVQVLAANTPLMLQAALALINGLILGFQANQPMVVNQILTILMAITGAILASIPIFIQAGGDMIVALIQGWTAAAGQADQAMIMLLRNMKNNAIKNMGMMLDIGRAIVDGVWQGIQANAAEFEAEVVGFFTGIVESVKAALGIKSPSAVFADIGRNMMSGLGRGFFGDLDAMQRRMASSLRTGLSGAALAGGTFGASISNSSENVGPFYGPVIIQGSTPAGSLGASLKARTY